MKITAAMVDRAMPIWEEIMKTPFIQEMIDGTLPVEKFKNYTIQDTLYIKGFSRTYAYGFINSDDIKIMRRFYQCMHVILADESMLHIRYLKEFYGMDEEKVYELKMEPENKAYTDYMVEIAKTGTAQESKTSPDHAVFISYAPSENPEIAMAVRKGYYSVLL